MGWQVSIDVEHFPILSKLAMMPCAAMEPAEVVSCHLQRLLNTRQGESLANPNYGLTDLVDLMDGLPHSAEQIGLSIEQCIRQFEPRLMVHKVTMTHDAPHHTLHFAIEASLIGEAHRRKSGAVMQLRGKLDEHGRIEVRL